MDWGESKPMTIVMSYLFKDPFKQNVYMWVAFTLPLVIQSRIMGDHKYSAFFKKLYSYLSARPSTICIWLIQDFLLHMMIWVRDTMHEWTQDSDPCCWSPGRCDLALHAMTLNPDCLAFLLSICPVICTLQARQRLSALWASLGILSAICWCLNFFEKLLKLSCSWCFQLMIMFG